MIKKLIEEDRLRKLKAQQAFNERMLAQNKTSALKNQTAMSQEDVGFFQGLLGRSSEEEQRRLAGNMYPGPQLSLFDRAKNALGDAWTNDNSSYKQGIWANNQIDAQELEQEKARAAAASAADQQAGSGQLAQQLWSPGLGAPNYQPKVKAAVDQGVNGVVPPGQFNFSQGKQLSNEDFGRTYGEQMNLANGKLAGNTYDPDSDVPFYKQGGFWQGALTEAAQRIFNESAFGNTPGLFTTPEDAVTSQLDAVEAEQEYNKPENVKLRADAARREAEVTAERDRMSLMGNAMSSYEPRPTPSLMNEEGRGGPAYPSMGPYQGLPFEGGPKNPEQMMYDGLNPDVKKQMDAIRESNAQVELDAYNAQINNPTADDIAPVSFVPTEVTSDTVIESVDAAVEVLTAGDGLTNDEYVERTLNGETNLGKFLSWIGIIGEETEDVSEDESNKTLKDLSTLVTTEEVTQEGLLVETDANAGGATHTMANGTVHTGVTHTSSSVPVNNGTSTTGVVTTPSLMNTTTDSTAGFTMDRFKNPLSAENKAWWLGGGGGVPGNNRAKEFFDTLAYIGTPLKYRPSKTPSQQGMENRMTNNNNMMDYAASMASSSSTANQNTFTKLKAAVPSQTSIASGIAGEFFDQAGMFEGKAETERRIDRRAAEIREKMLAMAAQGIYPTKEKVYAAEAKEAERLAEIKRLKEEEEARNQPDKAESSSWWSDLLN